MHQLGDGVLDLEAGVHLQEPEPLGGRVVEELDRAGAAVVDRLGRLAGGVVERGADLLAQARCRRLLHHLLVSALQGTVPVAVDARADDLDLHVPSALDVRLDEDRPVAERRLRLGLRGRDLAVQVGERADDPHAAAAATGGRLDQQREVRLARVLGRLQGRDPGLPHQLLGADLRAHRVDRLGRRADPGQPGTDDRAGEVGVLGQEAVARVDRVGAGGLGGGQHHGGVEVGLGRGVAGQRYGDVSLADVRQPGVRVGVDRDRRDAERAAGAEHPRRDLGAVGHHQSLDRHGRNTPNRSVPAYGLFSITERQMARMVRVSRGSMTPSS